MPGFFNIHHRKNTEFMRCFLTLFCCLLLSPAASAADENSIRIASVTVTGNSALTAPDLLEAADLKPGAAWNPELKALSGEIISSIYHSQGFMEASIKLAELEEGTSVFLRLEIIEGPHYKFGATRVTGLVKLTQKTVRKEFDYREGDHFSQEKLMNSQSRLYATNWFDSLRTKVSSTSAEGIDVDIQTLEKPLKWLTGGVGYGSEEKERFSLGVAHNNFLDQGYKLELGGMLSRIWLEYKAEFTNRHFLNSLTELHGSSAWRSETRKGYDLETFKNTVSLGRKLTPQVSASVQYSLQRSLLFHVDPLLSDETPSLSDIHTGGISLNRDTTDDFFYPTRGMRSELTLERAGGIWGGNINLYRGLLKNTAYARLFGGVTGLLSARGAFVQETGSTREVPVFERLFMGGANSVRGYSERGLGPMDSLGNPLGGKVLLGANAELRFPIYKKLQGAIFLDGGQVAYSLAGAAPKRWEYGAGAGLRYRTPVGPIRVDFGYKLNPDKPVTPELWRLHLSIGEAF